MKTRKAIEGDSFNWAKAAGKSHASLNFDKDVSNAEKGIVKFLNGKISEINSDKDEWNSSSKLVKKFDIEKLLRFTYIEFTDKQAMEDAIIDNSTLESVSAKFGVDFIETDGNKGTYHGILSIHNFSLDLDFYEPNDGYGYKIQKVKSVNTILTYKS